MVPLQLETNSLAAQLFEAPVLIIVTSFYCQVLGATSVDHQLILLADTVVCFSLLKYAPMLGFISMFLTTKPMQGFDTSKQWNFT